jgi:hypothetical protein
MTNSTDTEIVADNLLGALKGWKPAYESSMALPGPPRLLGSAPRGPRQGQ